MVDINNCIISKNMMVNRVDLNAISVIENNKDTQNKYDFDNYVYYECRALSATTLPGVIYVDYSKDNGVILKNSLSKLLNKTVYANHNSDTEKWIGKVVDVSWDENSAIRGINAVIRLPKPGTEYSTSYNSNVIKGLMSGSLDSLSVTVGFKVSMSHKNLSNTEFFEKQGMELNGDMVRCIVDEIVDYYEISIVSNGRDPNAKILNQIVVSKNSFNNDVDLAFNSREDFVNYLKTKEEVKPNIIKTDEIEIKNDIKGDKVMNNHESVDTTTSTTVQNHVQSMERNQFIVQDAVDKRITDLVSKVSALENSLSEKKSQIDNLQKVVGDKEQLISSLKRNLSKETFQSFSKECLGTGYMVNSQLLITTDGICELEAFYNSLDETQRDIFQRFVKASPLPSLLEMANSKTTVANNQQGYNQSLLNDKTQFIDMKMREIANSRNIAIKDVFSDSNLYQSIYTQAQREWKLFSGETY